MDKIVVQDAGVATGKLGGKRANYCCDPNLSTNPTNLNPNLTRLTDRTDPLDRTNPLNLIPVRPHSL